MTPAPIAVFVSVPFDWVAGILVPAAAVLVSAGIAIWLARRERRAAEEDRVGAAASRVVRSLTQLAGAASRDDPDGVKRADVDFQGDLNEFSVALDAKDADLPKYVAGVLAHSYRVGGFAGIARSASFLVGCVEGWVRGQLPTSRFTASMPPEADGVWTSAMRPEDWASKAEPSGGDDPRGLGAGFRAGGP